MYLLSWRNAPPAGGPSTQWGGVFPPPLCVGGARGRRLNPPLPYISRPRGVRYFSGGLAPPLWWGPPRGFVCSPPGGGPPSFFALLKKIMLYPPGLWPLPPPGKINIPPRGDIFFSPPTGFFQNLGKGCCGDINFLLRSRCFWEKYFAQTFCGGEKIFLFLGEFSLQKKGFFLKNFLPQILKGPPKPLLYNSLKKGTPFCCKCF